MERVQKQNENLESANSRRSAQGKFIANTPQADIASRLNNSPAMIAQRKKLQSLFGSAIQLHGAEEELKGGTAQKKPSGEYSSSGFVGTRANATAQMALASIDASGLHPKLSGQSDEAKKQGINNTKVAYGVDTLKSSGEQVGISMEANPIGPDHPQGTSPDTSVAKKHIAHFNKQDTYIRGHLLNGDIGGPGLAQNLFPITSQANSQHYHQIEKHVVSWVNDSKMYVHYKVDVVNRDDNKGKADFVCEAYPLDTSQNRTGTGIKATIHSEPGNSAGAAALDATGNLNANWVDGVLDDDAIEVQSGKVPKGYLAIDNLIFDQMNDDANKQAMLGSQLEVKLGNLGFSEKAIEELVLYVLTSDPAVFQNTNKPTWNKWALNLNNNYS